jgi:hypothetical protein
MPFRLWGRAALALLALVLLVGAYAISLYFWGDSRRRHTDAFDTNVGEPSADPGADWLLTGSDSRSGITSEQRWKLHVGNDQALGGLAMKNFAGGAGATTTVPVREEKAVPGVGDVVEWDRTKAGQLLSALRDDTAIPASDLK